MILFQSSIQQLLTYIFPKIFSTFQHILENKKVREKSINAYNILKLSSKMERIKMIEILV